MIEGDTPAVAYLAQGRAMIRWMAVAVAASVLLVTVSQGIADDSQGKVELQLELVDGSHLKCHAVDMAMTLPIEVGPIEIDLPLKQLQRLEWVDREADAGTSDDQTYASPSSAKSSEAGKVRILWDNGDQLTGTLGLEVVSVESVLGRINVPWDSIQRAEITFHPPPKPSFLTPVDVQVSGQYAHHLTKYASDGLRGGSWSSGDWKGWIEFDLGETYELAKVEASLQFAPSGQAVHEVYISDEPMRGNIEGGRLVKRFSGHRQNNDVLSAECEPGTRGRYVQLRCPRSRAWFNVRELEVYPRN